MRLCVTVRTKRLILRPWREDDLDPFAHLTADPLSEEIPSVGLDSQGCS